MNYEEYLKSEHWQEVKKVKLKTTNYRCQLCNSPLNLNVHHRCYDHINEEQNHLEDLVILCKDCHKRFHETLPKPPKHKFITIEEILEEKEKFIKMYDERIEYLETRKKKYGNLRKDEYIEMYDTLIKEKKEEKEKVIKELEKSEKILELKKEREQLREELESQSNHDTSCFVGKTIEEIDKEIEGYLLEGKDNDGL